MCDPRERCRCTCKARTKSPLQTHVHQTQGQHTRRRDKNNNEKSKNGSRLDRWEIRAKKKITEQPNHWCSLIPRADLTRFYSNISLIKQELASQLRERLLLQSYWGPLSRAGPPGEDSTRSRRSWKASASSGSARRPRPS